MARAACPVTCKAYVTRVRGKYHNTVTLLRRNNEKKQLRHG